MTMANKVEIFLGMNIKKFIEGTNKAEKRAKKFRDNLVNVEKQMKSVQKGSAIAFGAIAGIIGLTAKPAIALQDEIRNALTLVDVQGAEFKKMESDMEKLASKMARELGMSAADVASGFYNVLSSGAEAMSDDFESLAMVALKMGKTVGLETAASVEVLSDTIGAFNLELTDAEKVADVFFTTSKLAATTVPQLADAFKEAGATAATMKLSLEETAAILGTFASKGIKGAQAGTLFRIMATRMGAATGEAATALQRLGVDAFDPITRKMRPMTDIIIEMSAATAKMTDEQRNLTLKTIVGEEAFAKFGGVLAGDLTKIKEWEKRLHETGALQKAFNIKMDSFTGQMQLAKAELEAAAIAVGKAFLPSLLKLVRAVADIASKMVPWIEGNQRLLKVLAGVGLGGAGILAAMSTFGLLLVKLPVLLAAATGPIGLLTMAIMAAAAAVVYFVMKSQKIPGTIDEIDVRIANNKKSMVGLKNEMEELTTQWGKGFESWEAGNHQMKAAQDKYRLLSVELKGHTDRVKTLNDAKNTLIETDKRSTEAKELAAQTEKDEIERKENLAIKSRSIAAILTDAVIPKVKEATEGQKEWTAEIDETAIHLPELIAIAQYEIDALRDDLMDLATWMIDVFAVSFEQVERSSKTFIENLGYAFLVGFVRIARAFIEAEIMKVVAKKIEQIAEATIAAPLSFGATLLAIGPIVAAAAAGIAALGALSGAAEARIMKMEMGGMMGSSGLVYAHQGEMFFNPRTQSPDQLSTMMAGAGVGMPAGGNPINVFANHYGPMNTQLDVKQMSREIGRQVRRAVNREVE